MKMGCAGVPTLTEYIRERLGAGGVLGMDAERVWHRQEWSG